MPSRRSQVKVSGAQRFGRPRLAFEWAAEVGHWEMDLK
jgi:hypothetical protein